MGIFLVFSLGLSWQIKNNYQSLFVLIKNFFANPFQAFLVLSLVKFIGIVYPPIPGGLFLIASVPFLDWKIPFFANVIGSVFGGVVNYWVARVFGESAVKNLLGAVWWERLRKVKIRKGREFEALILARVGLAGALEGVQYMAGLLRVNFLWYLLASLLSDIIIGFLFFWLLSKGFKLFSLPLSVFLSLLLLLLLWKGKGRYLQEG